MKKKNWWKRNWWKVALLIFVITACISIPLVLYFTIGQKNNNGEDNSEQINLDEQNVSYLADVEFMNKITGDEATTIRKDIQDNINNKMNSLNLEVNVDYTVNNLNDIQANVNLNDVNVTVNSVETSTKAIGNLTVKLNVRENMNNRTIDTIMVPAKEANGLDALTADGIQGKIRIDVQDILTGGQDNDENIDYIIDNINLIVAGAKFNEYSTIISVIPKTSSTHLTGSFKIKFELQ